jgi:hypothetical protein
MIAFVAETRSWTAYDLYTGQKVWGPTESYASPWSYYSSGGYYNPIAAYGNLYAAGFGGEVYAYDLKTGKTVWKFLTGSSGYETPYGTWPVLHVDAVADGKVYVMGGHVYSTPLFRGSNLWCLNATTGDLLWTIYNFATTNGASCALADGYLIEPNAYDNQVYSYGMGPSKTTVTAPGVGVTTGTPITISGTVTDISAGSQQDAVAANFPNGLPCVSDESMTDWMQYVYMQQPRPTNATGVPVRIDVIDSNNNYRTIGTAKSDASGKFGFTWTPDIPGDFTIIATFEGSKSYYPSFDEAFFTATEAPHATAVPTQPPASLADQYILPGIGGIIAAIAVVGVVLALIMLRKK